MKNVGKRVKNNPSHIFRLFQRYFEKKNCSLIIICVSFLYYTVLKNQELLLKQIKRWQGFIMAVRKMRFLMNLTIFVSPLINIFIKSTTLTTRSRHKICKYSHIYHASLYLIVPYILYAKLSLRESFLIRVQFLGHSLCVSLLACQKKNYERANDKLGTLLHVWQPWVVFCPFMAKFLFENRYRYVEAIQS